MKHCLLLHMNILDFLKNVIHSLDYLVNIY